MTPLLVFTGFYVLVYAGEPIKYGYLTIYMRSDLHLPAAVSGAVIGIQPLVEADPHAGGCHRRPTPPGGSRGDRVGHLHEFDGSRHCFGRSDGQRGVALFGLPHVFLAPAVYGLVATAGIAVMSRSRHAVN